MAELKDSGVRREFESGAVRDIAEGKGRCDLLPLSVVSDLVEDENASEILRRIDRFIYGGDTQDILSAIDTFIEDMLGIDLYTAVLETSKHYEDGCRKYGERNWEKGISVHSFVDSGVRHLLKFMRGDDDEPHDRAFLWNMFAIIWTVQHKSDMIDLPFKSRIV